MACSSGRSRHTPRWCMWMGFWVHQGTAQANADWARVLEDVRDERLRAVGSN